MLNQVKVKLREQLYNTCYRRYLEQTGKQSDRYGAFLTQQDQPAVLDLSGVLRRETIQGSGRPDGGTAGEELPGEPQEEALRVLRTDCCQVFLTGEGIAEKRTAESFDRFFGAHPELCAAYADEDYVKRNGRRHSPWFKPEFSPDTLADSFYPGNIFAVRRGTDKEAASADAARTFFLAAVAGGIKNGGGQPAGRLDEILWHGFAEEGDCDSRYLPLPQDNPLAELFREMQEKSGGFSAQVYAMGVKNALEHRKMVSVIIPSKDNPQVLRTCIASLREHTAGIGYELIVVDNGSTPENRQELESLARELSFSYVYEPMEFNFSRMCNLGASHAVCPYLLFLNDDMELTGRDWMLQLYEKAALPHAGAVGAKLLYPGGALIQHVGVTNLAVGPAHKLLKQDDSAVLYHGRNRGVHDMLAVTAACLMVERKKYDGAAGFCEDIAVSYNDVDFCFSLFEKGYYNIQRNDVTLFHHESLSRGDDNLSDEKWERLLQEKDRLYRRHPNLKGRDPFYSPHLAAHFSDYICSFEYPYERRDCYTGIKTFRGKEPLAWQNDCLTVNVEHARAERRLDLSEEKEVLWIEGWSYVLGMDNCRYKRKLLLLAEDGAGYEARLFDRYREDVEDILPNQQNVALAGFSLRIPRDKVKPGVYHIAMLAKDACSNQKLYRRTQTILTVE